MAIPQAYNTNVIIEFTTGASDTFLFIYYWADSLGDYAICYDSINITQLIKREAIKNDKENRLNGSTHRQIF